jgi:hypothetical protein
LRRESEHRNARRQLERLSLEARSRAAGGGAQAAALLGLARHYAACATLVAQHYLFRNEQPIELLPGDDGTLEFAKLMNVYVPGNEVEIAPDAPSFPWTDMFADPKCGIFLVLGQSNAGNHGAECYAPKHEVFSLNFLDMKCCPAIDPLGGASGAAGSVWSRLGDRLIGEGLFERVLFVPLAFGGSFVKDWAPGGAFNRRLALALSRLRACLGERMLDFTGVLWQQGEADANHTTMPTSVYRQRIHEIVASLRAYDVYSPFFVAVSTLCEAGPHPCNNHDEIRRAQLSLPDPVAGILAGPDTDRITGSGRSDGCHLSAEGLATCADIWFDVLRDARPLLLQLSPR